MTVVHHLRGFSVQKLRCLADRRPVRLGDRLMSEAHTEYRGLPCALAHNRDARSCIGRGSRSRGQQHSVVGQAVRRCDGIVSDHGDVGP